MAFARPGAALLGFALLLAMGVLPTSAAAREGIVLEWEGPPSCPDREAVQAEIDALLGAIRPSEHEPSVYAHGEVREVESSFVLVLRTRRGEDEGLRELTAGTCEELAESAALILALLLSPDGLSADVEPPRAEMPAEQDPEPSPSPERAPPPVPVPRPFVRVALLAAGIADLGALPRPSFGGTLGLRLTWGRFDLALEVGGLGRRDIAFDTDPPVEGSFRLIVIGLRACHATVDGRVVAAGPCLGFEGGALHGRGRGATDPGSGGSGWISPKAGAFLGFALASRVWLRMTAEAIVPLVRTRFHVEGLGELYRVPPLSGRVGLGIEYRFP